MSYLHIPVKKRKVKEKERSNTERKEEERSDTKRKEEKKKREMNREEQDCVKNLKSILEIQSWWESGHNPDINDPLWSAVIGSARNDFNKHYKKKGMLQRGKIVAITTKSLQ